MSKDVLGGEWAGRFFRLPGPVFSTTDDLRESVAQQEWRPLPKPLPMRVRPKIWSFCSTLFPHEGGLADLDADGESIHYGVQDGCTIVALRCDARAVPPHALRVAIHERALKEVGRGWSQISGAVRRDLREVVEQELLPRQEPRSRSFSVAVVDTMAFVQRCPAADIKAVRGLLAALTPNGRMPLEDPIVWDATVEEDVKFHELGQLFLGRLVKTQSLDLDADVHLMGLQIGESALRLRSREVSERAITLIQTARENRLDDVMQISVQVDLEGGDIVDLEIRPEGLVRVRLPRSEAGLPREILRSRWSQVKEAGERVQEVARALRGA